MTSQRIIWIQDLNPLMAEGGAQMTDAGHIREGIKRGYNIYILTPENAPSLELHVSDFLVVSNCTRFDKNLLRTLHQKVKYVVFHHDFHTICMYRLYFPLTEKCFTRCPESPIWRPVVENAQLNIFLSPLHYQMHEAVFGAAVSKHVEIPSAIDTKKFFDKGEPRDRDVTSINGLIDFKGRDENLEYARKHPELNFDFAGDNAAVELPANCKYHGMVIYQKMNDWLNKYKYYMELPRNSQPFNRTVAEAYLAGCKVIGNELLGALSWPWFNSRESVKQHIDDAPRQFWESVEGVMNG